ncbi:acyloxyacyl hydrolase [Aggregatimonas sangjinii]|uniref:Acyloxyacyl hydrolase n=1 Tax=Aggregatimonas sangjinii TaxID=2583587 RepID=A0A5B7SUX0_9FLAO|nr:acyloxyacyl hydrolase [Aggregatimonas sangjinii]QCX00630.1 acyloxyacyl hydrolase [Aggregatimonas sangjinii]
MIRFFTVALLFSFYITNAQNIVTQEIPNKFRSIEVKSNYGSYLYTGTALSEAGFLDAGYGAINVKIGWQSNNTESWAGYYKYPTYGIGLYSGFLGNAQVFGNPSAVYGFMDFPIGNPNRRNKFSIEPALGITYNLQEYNAEENPINDAFGARAAVYFGLDFGFEYRFTRELDLTYGFDFTHFSNGSSYQPNLGLNLFGINLGIKYNYNAAQRMVDNDPYTKNLVQARFKSPEKTKLTKINENSISLYLAGGGKQTDEDGGTDRQFGVFSGVLDYEHRFNAIHGVTGGFDFFYDNTFQEFDKAAERTSIGIHAGYDFNFWKLVIKAQLGTYLTDDLGKGAFFMRPAIRYNLNNTFFAQMGLKTLDGGAADYIEFGIGFKPFKW